MYIKIEILENRYLAPHQTNVSKDHNNEILQKHFVQDIKLRNYIKHITLQFWLVLYTTFRAAKELHFVTKVVCTTSDCKNCKIIILIYAVLRIPTINHHT